MYRAATVDMCQKQSPDIRITEYGKLWYRICYKRKQNFGEETCIQTATRETKTENNIKTD